MTALPPREFAARLHDGIERLIEAGGALSEAALGYVDLDLLNAWSAAVQEMTPFMEGDITLGEEK